MIISTVSHDEATIRHFVEDPSYAALYLQTVLADGDLEEIREVKGWVEEAKARRLQTDSLAEA